MATENTAPQADEAADETRRPYVVVLMSAEMKDALKAYAKAHDTNPTEFGRVLFAQAIGYDLSKEPAPARRSSYTTDEERAAAKKVASRKSGLLRKALFQVHTSQLKNRAETLKVASAIVMALSSDTKYSLEELESFDANLDAAIKAGA